jgi:hypothetical protein
MSPRAKAGSIDSLSYIGFDVDHTSIAGRGETTVSAERYCDAEMMPMIRYSREDDDDRGFRIGSEAQRFPSHQSASYDGRQIQGL